MSINETLNNDEKNLIDEIAKMPESLDFKAAAFLIDTQLFNPDFNVDWSKIRKEALIEALKQIKDVLGLEVKDIKINGVSISEFTSEVKSEVLSGAEDTVFKGISESKSESEVSPAQVAELIPGVSKSNSETNLLDVPDNNSNGNGQGNPLSSIITAGSNSIGSLATLPFRSISSVVDKLESWRDGQPATALTDAKKSSEDLEILIDKFKDNSNVAEAIKKFEEKGDFSYISKVITDNPEISNIWSSMNDKFTSTMSLWRKAARANAKEGNDITDQMDFSMDKIRDKTRAVPSKFKLNGEVEETMAQRINKLTEKITKMIKKIMSKFSKNNSFGMN